MMKRLLASFVILANFTFPIRFGLAELTRLSEPPHVARRIELPQRQKEAGHFAELKAQIKGFRLSSSDGRKHIRRSLYTKGDSLNIPQPAGYQTISLAGRTLILFATPSGCQAFPSQYLRAPPVRF